MTFNRKAAAVAIALPMVCGSEGLRQYVYRDPVGIPTYCFGETDNPEWGKHYSVQECTDLVRKRVAEFVEAADNCTGNKAKPHELAGFGSMAYNIGKSAFCAASPAQYARAGDMVKACMSINQNAVTGAPQWVYAKYLGVMVKLPGLVTRRAEERAVCEGRLPANHGK